MSANLGISIRQPINLSITKVSAAGMQQGIYDPRAIQKDVFDRANHTGTQLASTISDFNAAVNAAVSGSSVTSVNTRTGAVTLTKTDVGLANVDNTADTAKPVSTATQTALNAKQNTVTLTTTGSSGAATFNSSTGALNVPQYTGGGSSATNRMVIFVAANDATTEQKALATATYTCDGVADQVQLQAAHDALPTTGGLVQMLGTQFNFSSSFNVLLRKGFYLKGESQQKTVLFASNGLNDYVIKFMQLDNATAYDTWATFSDFKIDGNCTNQTSGGGIDAKGAIESVFERIWFYKCYDWGIRFRAIQTVGALNYGHHNKVMHCHFDEGQQAGGQGQGIYITQSDENEIHSNDFQYMGGFGISTTACILDVSAGLNNIHDNVFVTCREGIRFQDSSRSKAQDNTFDLLLDNNIVLKGEELLVGGNTFYQPSASCIYQDYYGHNTIVGNSFRSHDTNGTTRSFIRDNGNATVGGKNIYAANKFYISGTLAVAPYENTLGTIDNIMVGNKGALEGSIFGAQLAMKEQAAPATMTGYGQFYADSTTHHPSFRDSTGTVYDLSTSSGGGGTGITWSEVTITSQTAVTNNGYVANNAAIVTITLPATAVLGSVIEVAGKGAGGWKIGQAASQLIKFGNATSTTGTGGSIASSVLTDSIRLVCTVANTTWTVVSAVGNLVVT